jgi:hypothetical protein
MASAKFHDLAQRFVAFEAARVNASDEVVDAAAQIIEKLRLRLVKLAGVEGFRSLLLPRSGAGPRCRRRRCRSCRWAQTALCKGRPEIEPHPSSGTTGQDGIILVAHLLELLVTFIGETLTLQLVRDIWPDASINRANPSTEEKA